MKTNKDFILREIADEVMLIPTGQAAQQINGMIRLTPTAAFIFQKVDECNSLDEVVTKVTEEFDVDDETARTDVYGFLYQLYIRNIILDIREFDNKDEK